MGQSASGIYRKQKCYNCKHAGKQFKVAGKTHLHCEHFKWEKKHEESEHGISAWDTLCEWWDTCSDFEPKASLNGG